MKIETHFIYKDTKLIVKHQLYHGNQKKTGVAVLISEKVEFRTRKCNRDEERDYVKIFM